VKLFLKLSNLGFKKVGGTISTSEAGGHPDQEVLKSPDGAAIISEGFLELSLELGVEHDS
jgi:hypothetical protein